MCSKIVVKEETHFPKLYFHTRKEAAEASPMVLAGNGGSKGRRQQVENIIIIIFL